MVRELRGAIAVACGAVAIAVVPASARAVDATSEYHPDLDARSFVSSVGGWTADSSATGPCVPMLSCPEITSEFAAGDGTGGAGDGHLRTSIADLLGVAGESRAIWTSPPFAYAGAGGQPPTRVELTISRRTEISAFLSALGNEADYSVELVDDTAGGVALRVIDQAQLSTTAGWTRSPLMSIDPSELTIGHSYRLRIVSRFAYTAEVQGGGDADYDDVILRALRTEPVPPPPGPPGPPGNPGTPGTPGGGGDGGGGGGGGQGGGGNNPGAGSAIFDGRNLFIKLKCFGVQRNGKCRSRATALQSKKGKRYTFPIQRKVKAKKGKVIRARVRFRFRKQLERQRSIVLRSALTTSRRDASKTIKFKKLKLIKRGN
jgi:hypothetical protein